MEPEEWKSVPCGGCDAELNPGLDIPWFGYDTIVGMNTVDEGGAAGGAYAGGGCVIDEVAAGATAAVDPFAITNLTMTTTATMPPTNSTQPTTMPTINPTLEPSSSSEIKIFQT